MRAILFFLLVLLAAPTWAEWVKFDSNVNGVFYADPTTIRKDGQFRRVWVIRDLNKRDKDGKMSVRILNEYDCKDERARGVSFSSHSEPMAGGKLLTSFNEPTKWNYISPETVGESMLDFVC